MYIDKADFDKLIKADQLDTITDSDDTKIDEAILAAQEEVFAYLRARYDVTEVQQQTGSDRNNLLIIYIADVALYHLFSRLTPRNVPELRINRYERVLEFLSRVQSLKASLDLPEYDDEDKQYVLSGSNRPRNHHY